MSRELQQRLYDELVSIPLIDPHTHINAHNPASTSLADILGYHYYTELAHSAGLPREQIEQPGLDPREKVGRLFERMDALDNTVQHSWFLEMARRLLGFEGDRIDQSNWEEVYDLAERRMASETWADEVLAASGLEGVFLTNDFDDPLRGFDTRKYIPCLRTDDLVFHLGKRSVVERFERAGRESLTGVAALRRMIGRLFDHFARNNAKACAISLPPDFEPQPVSSARADTALAAVLRQGPEALESHRRALANFVFWTLAEHCRDYRLPFDLMIGVNRAVYEHGVYQGQDLYDSRVSLIQYRRLFNAFPDVTFPVSVLASVTNQELTSYAWIFPNVVTNGHWWYSNTPTFLEHDAAARLEAVPRTKQIGYYSDMYKLEFALPKFNMYRRVLAKILAERFVLDRGWSEERAVALGKQVLRDNVESVFRVGACESGVYLPAGLLDEESEELETPDESSGAAGLEESPPDAAWGALPFAAAAATGGEELESEDVSWGERMGGAATAPTPFSPEPLGAEPGEPAEESDEGADGDWEAVDLDQPDWNAPALNTPAINVLGDADQAPVQPTPGEQPPQDEWDTEVPTSQLAPVPPMPPASADEESLDLEAPLDLEEVVDLDDAFSEEPSEQDTLRSVGAAPAAMESSGQTESTGASDWNDSLGEDSLPGLSLASPPPEPLELAPLDDLADGDDEAPLELELGDLDDDEVRSEE